MNIDDKKDFARATDDMMLLCGTKADNRLYSLYFDEFKDYNLNEVKQAFKLFVRNEEPFGIPKIATIRKYLQSAPVAITAADAWAHFPKGDHESGFVTPRMLAAWGASESSWYEGNQKGAEFAFKESYNNRPDLDVDISFQYTEADGGDFEEKLIRKENDVKQLEYKSWIPKQQLIKLKQSLGMQATQQKKLNTPTLNKSLSPMTDDGSNKTQKELNKKRASELRSTMSEMLCLKKDTTSTDN